jgi:vesicle-associated membrane protein-associated protein A
MYHTLEPTSVIPIPDHLFELTPAPSQQPEERASTPIQDAVERRSSGQTVIQDPPHVLESDYPPESPVVLTKPSTSESISVDATVEPIPEPQDSVPAPAPLSVPVQRQVDPGRVTAPPITSPPEFMPEPVIITKENPLNEELYNLAQGEIE